MRPATILLVSICVAIAVAFICPNLPQYSERGPLLSEMPPVSVLKGLKPDSSCGTGSNQYRQYGSYWFWVVGDSKEISEQLRDELHRYGFEEHDGHMSREDSDSTRVSVLVSDGVWEGEVTVMIVVDRPRQRWTWR